MSESKLLRGTFVLTLGTYISRILGMIYVIPFYALVSEIGGALYSYGYGQYTIFLFISTLGFPLAVSKFVSKYNSLGDYYTGRRILKSGLLVMTLMGGLGFLVLFSFAPILAEIVLGGSGDQHGNKVEDVVLVMRMVSVALIVVPIMSLLRGFFQGYQSMGPTAVSQVVEQVVRIAFLLGSSFIIMRVLEGEIATAVAFSTFSAFIGALGGLGVLIWYWIKRKPHLDEMLEKSRPAAVMTTKEMYKELFSYAGPFVLVGLAIPLYQYVDQLTFNRAMVEIGKGAIAEELFGMINLFVPKLVMIPVSLATAFSLTLVPTITNSFTSGDFTILRRQIDKTFQICVLLVLPAVVGLSVLAYPAYASFYEISEAGGRILQWYAPVAILFSFFTITAAILQGINKQKFAVISLFFGFIVKMIFNVPFILWFGEIGAILATALGFTLSILYSFWMISRHAHYKFKLFARRSFLMSIFAGVMMVSILLVNYLFSNVFTYEDGKIYSVILLLVGVGVGAGIYLFLTYRSHLLERLMGNQLEKILSRFKRKQVKEQ
ncbi:putative polysaccharide biosynthesis protein [Litchfieldia salsa]|uniref:Membrane protein involved in the export of O-antigen and teichoic acid n=1 Tax=Litchfieldia salsa TaxID=930152 RepID=A0A1H0P9J1_9BACI|nr:polysaccharide biosynthesis protein [Litchfieldia salsa]SDP01732.1 Membrane protein involved in the export of O-antigen and teichoic acid [Litchfieldia salsa]